MIDVIKINSKNIIDIISKYEGGIDEIIDVKNKYYSKQTHNKSLFKGYYNDDKNLMKSKNKVRNASATIINKLLKCKLVKIKPVYTKENSLNNKVVQDELVTSNINDVCINEKIHDPLPQDYRSNFGCNSCNSCHTSKSFVTKFHDGIDASIFSIHEQHNDIEQNIDNNADEIDNEDSISNNNINFTPTIETISNEESVDDDNDDSDEESVNDNSE